MSASPLLLFSRQSRLQPVAGSLATTLLGGALVFLALRPVFGLIHELVVVGLAAALRLLTLGLPWERLIAVLPVDPVYTLAMIRFAGHIDVIGIAVAGRPGELLHELLPALFASPVLLADRWISAVLEPGSTVLARGLVGFGADTGLLLVGLALFLLGLRRWPWLVVVGALQQAHVVLYHFVDAEVSIRELEAAGLPFALSSLLSSETQRAPWFTRELASLPEPLVAAASGLLLTGLGYLLAALALGLLRWLTPDGLSGALRSHRLVETSVSPRAKLLVVIGVVGLATSPLGAFAEAETVVRETASASAALAVQSLVPGPRPQVEPIAARGPVEVQFQGQQYDFTLLVNGQPTIIRGMGYNPQYAALPPEERARRYDRDFELMRAAGVNVIFGWFEDQFDELTLDKAYEHGLGVAIPYELNQDWNYDDPAVRARITENVLAKVVRLKDHPALWFWTPGNEVIHRLIFPSWLKHEVDPVREARADSFARFYVELIDQIHAHDPRHPVIYRDAEEVYLKRIRDELLKGGQRRPWFAYGANVYSSRLREILAGWPTQGLDVPLFVSEFSPGGTGPIDRPRGLREMWSTIRSYPGWVIGGAVYTWTTDGPEELDRVFGLVDEQAQARDGSLATIAELYRDRPATP